MKSKKKIMILFFFVFWNASWAMTNEGYPEKKKKEIEKLDLCSISTDTCRKIFDFLLPKDILSFLLIKNYADQIHEEACRACSIQPLSITNKNIDTSVFSNIKKSCYRDLEKLDLSGSIFDLSALSLIPQTLVELSLDNIHRQPQGMHDHSLFMKHLLLSFSSLTNLKKISLRKNEMNDNDIAKIIDTVKSLNIKKFNINDNSMSISQMPKMLILDLTANQIGAQGAEHISKLQSLNSLHLAWNQIGNEGTEYISRLKSLTALNLRNNGVSTEGARYISSLSGLITLNLSWNRVGDEGAWYISRLPVLTILDLSFNNISDEGAQHISTIPRITTLHLIWNKIGDEGAQHISTMLSLKTLKIRTNNIRKQGIELILNMPNLISLDISDNPA
jgi:Leucine-rich repeat (LRR) protein